MEINESTVRHLLVKGEIRLAGYYLKTLPQGNLHKIWKAILENEFSLLHQFLQFEQEPFQLELMKFIATMLCDLCIALSNEQVVYYLGPYASVLVNDFQWAKEGDFYILKHKPNALFKVSELEQLSDVLNK